MELCFDRLSVSSMPPTFQGVEKCRKLSRMIYLRLPVHTSVCTSKWGINACSGPGSSTHLTMFWSLSLHRIQPASFYKREKLPEREHAGKVESACSNKDALRSVIPTLRCASRLWKCDESGQALGYVAVALNTECVSCLNLKSWCS